MLSKINYRSLASKILVIVLLIPLFFIFQNMSYVDNSSSVDFMSYDVINIANNSKGQGVYQMVNESNGTLYATIVVKKEKRFNWQKAPKIAVKTNSRNDSWYVQETYFSKTKYCSNFNPPRNENIRQIAHRMIDRDGNVWELGGQPQTTCGDQTFNVYADIEKGSAPLIMAPSDSADSKTFLSEWWIAPRPFNSPPSGYPFVLDSQPAYAPIDHFKNFALSWAKVISRHKSLSVKIGDKIKTYYDVVGVFWVHGSKYTKTQFDEITSSGIHPCSELNSTSDPVLLRHKSLSEKGWNTYSILKYYARHKPEINQIGGIIQEELLWKCSDKQSVGSKSNFGKAINPETGKPNYIRKVRRF